MLWINFLHFYQPANIEKDKIAEATKRSYERIIRALEEHPEIKFTMNISGCLVLRWSEEFHYIKLINRIKILIERGQIELTGSAAYHPLLPLIPLNEAEKQIKTNEKILKKYFGNKLKLRGFFFPEMAINKETAVLIKKLGYSWIIIDEISKNGKLNQVDFNKKYLEQTSNLKVVFRNRQYSESYVPETVLNLIKNNNESLVISASDAELYGLRHIDHVADFEKLLKTPGLKTLTISNFLNTIKSTKKFNLVSASWQSSEQELKNQQPFILWTDKNNKIHKKLWQLANIAQNLNTNHDSDQNASWSRWHLVRGLASCMFWWASAKDFSQVFGPIAWNPDEIEKGVNELIRSIRSLEQSTDLQTKLMAEKLTFEIKNLIWEKHWRTHKK